MIAYEGKASMLIRKPVAEVFEAIVDPAITSRFWFTKGSGRLEKGKRVRWDWEMYGASAQVLVLELEKDRRVLIEWSGAGQPPTTVEWTFAARAGTTYVTIANRGFGGSQDEIVKQAIDSTGGFAFHLAGLKAVLEHDIDLNLTADHHPKD
ncbi:SRPBCC family protein [bacterium]|nr:SRPBCC family protein [bacterium]